MKMQKATLSASLIAMTMGEVLAVATAASASSNVGALPRCVQEAIGPQAEPPAVISAGQNTSDVMNRSIPDVMTSLLNVRVSDKQGDHYLNKGLGQFGVRYNPGKPSFNSFGPQGQTGYGGVLNLGTAEKSPGSDLAYCSWFMIGPWDGEGKLTDNQSYLAVPASLDLRNDGQWQIRVNDGDGNMKTIRVGQSTRIEYSDADMEIKLVDAKFLDPSQGTASVGVASIEVRMVRSS